MISFLHIATDEKFINAAHYIFDKAFPESNRFIILTSKYNKKLKHVTPANNMSFISRTKKGIQTVLKLTNEYDCILMHGIHALNSSIFLKAHHKNKFVGIFWGAELYKRPVFMGYNVYGDITRKVLLQINGQSQLELIKQKIKDAVYGKTDKVIDVMKTMSQLKYFASINPISFNYFVNRDVINKDCKLIPFTYFPLEFILKGIGGVEILGNNILLGNSASATNNHIEAFELINKFSLSNRKVITPLSYGNAKYADLIDKKGKGYFNSKFQSLREFMPLSEYNHIKKSCGIVLMNHKRPEGIGNLIASLYMGAKVYLNKSNFAYSYFKELGIILYSIEEDFTPKNTHALSNLKESEIENNKRILEKKFSEKVVVNNLHESIKSYFG